MNTDLVEETTETQPATETPDTAAMEPGEGAQTEAVFELGAPDLRAALEALLVIAEDPVSVADLEEVTAATSDEIEATLHDLAAGYREEGRGFELREVDGGWRFYSAQSCAELVGRYVTDGRQSRLSQAALETLTIIAYRQPVSRAHIGSVRGVNSDGVIRTLVARGLIQDTAEDASTGAVLYGTTQYFLDRMGIDSITDLPPVAEHIPDPSTVDDL